MLLIVGYWSLVIEDQEPITNDYLARANYYASQGFSIKPQVGLLIAKSISRAKTAKP